MALGLAGLASKPLFAQTQAGDVNGPNWPGTLQGCHRQVVDAYAVNDGSPLGFAHTFLAFNKSTTSFSVMTPSR